MSEILWKRFNTTGDWPRSVDFVGRRIEDKMLEVPQEQELIVESVKLFRDRLNEKLRPVAEPELLKRLAGA